MGGAQSIRIGIDFSFAILVTKCRFLKNCTRIFIEENCNCNSYREKNCNFNCQRERIQFLFKKPIKYDHDVIKAVTIYTQHENRICTTSVMIFSVTHTLSLSDYLSLVHILVYVIYTTNCTFANDCLI